MKKTLFTYIKPCVKKQNAMKLPQPQLKKQRLKKQIILQTIKDQLQLRKWNT